MRFRSFFFFFFFFGSSSPCCCCCCCCPAAADTRSRSAACWMMHESINQSYRCMSHHTQAPPPIP